MSPLGQGLGGLIEIGCCVAVVAVIVAITSESRVEVGEIRGQIVDAIGRAHVVMHEIVTIARMCLAAIKTVLMSGRERS